VRRPRPLPARARATPWRPPPIPTSSNQPRPSPSSSPTPSSSGPATAPRPSGCARPRWRLSWTPTVRTVRSWTPAQSQRRSLAATRACADVRFPAFPEGFEPGPLGPRRDPSMAAPRTYPPELKERALRLWRSSTPRRPIAHVARELGSTRRRCGPRSARPRPTAASAVTSPPPPRLRSCAGRTSSCAAQARSSRRRVPISPRSQARPGDGHDVRQRAS
jgi:hypothetical protein